ncbi:hypothetical protein GLX25_12710 [Agromyces luteolus]|uniref:NTP pyrophosphohydrolase n=2 Tax=Agromyces luteolus TaxID=88373 RepID=A0A7C9LZZ6_9MICO|nr:hypothetical protein [Agromyces luteolus]MUN07973.1 hypothetical protein [Agromyces luteolus]
MGSRPDGWWRDRAGAATRLLERMPHLVGREVAAPDGAGGPIVAISRIVAVLEGAARAATAPRGVDVVRAPADGDGAIVDETARLAEAGERVLVVTADRGLRARLDAGALVTGPGWFNEVLGR